MRTITKIACRAVGTLGMGVALFDAGRTAKHFSKVQGELSKANQLEKAYFSTRTLDNYSDFSNKIQKDAFELRSKLPLPTVVGKIKGGVKGFLSSLGNHLPSIAFSSMALLCKGIGAKIGVVGLLLSLVYEVARNGFGLNKHNPMD